MKALSLWQPWASLMALGVKQNETRSWPTSHRGDLLICAAKRMPTPDEDRIGWEFHKGASRAGEVAAGRNVAEWAQQQSGH